MMYSIVFTQEANPSLCKRLNATLDLTKETVKFYVMYVPSYSAGKMQPHIFCRQVGDDDRALPGSFLFEFISTDPAFFHGPTPDSIAFIIHQLIRIVGKACYRAQRIRFPTSQYLRVDNWFEIYHSDSSKFFAQISVENLRIQYDLAVKKQHEVCVQMPSAIEQGSGSKRKEAPTDFLSTFNVPIPPIPDHDHYVSKAPHVESNVCVSSQCVLQSVIEQDHSSDLPGTSGPDWDSNTEGELGLPFFDRAYWDGSETL